MDLSIVIVNYNTKKMLKDCLDSIVKNSEGLHYEIIVVDNASIDGSRELLKKDFPEVVLVINKKNVGFAKACNQGIVIASGENILLLNSDTVVLKDSLLGAVKFAERNPDAGIIGCRVLNPDGTLQYSCYHAPIILTELIFFTKCIIKDLWDPFSYYKYMKYWDHNQIAEVDCISGCFMLIKEELFQEVGYFDEKFFMYYEDSEFCLRVKRKSDYKIYYVPDSKIIHVKGVSSFSYNHVVIKECYSSANYFLVKCYGKTAGVIFNLLCNIIWIFEIAFMYLFIFNSKAREKMELLRLLRHP